MEYHFPYNVKEELGEIQFFEEECLGVYYLSCRQEGEESRCREFYIVEETATAISSKVKRMGQRLSSCPNLLAYEVQTVSGMQKIIEYEVSKFRTINGLPLAEGVTLHSIAMDGMETNPEYFGTFPVPYHTPWGCTLRHKAIGNGVYWIETDQCRRVLAICYILQDELSDAARKLAVQERRDREEGLDHTMGYLFFSEYTSCIPIFELMQVYRQWENSCIDKKALENAIWHYYPEYAAVHNMQEAAGQHSMMLQIFRSFGDDLDLSGLEDQMISLSPDANMKFCTLLE